MTTMVQEEGDRGGQLRQALWLEWLTVGWNVVEGVVGVSAAVAAESVALLGFGIDSFVESASGGWWWADPVAALGMTPLLIREGLEAWRGEDCCRDGQHV